MWPNLDRSLPPATSRTSDVRANDRCDDGRVKESANLWRAEEIEKSRGFGEDSE